MKRILGITVLLAALALAGSALAFSTGDQLQFSRKSFAGGQKLPVYSGPGYEYVRVNGNASVSTDDTIWMAGRHGDWALIMYRKSAGGYRVGWIDASRLQYRLGGSSLILAHDRFRVNTTCTLTDDPKNRSSSLATVQRGSTVTCLCEYYDHMEWAYVEIWNGGPMCGFVPMDCLDSY